MYGLFVNRELKQRQRRRLEKMNSYFISEIRDCLDLLLKTFLSQSGVQF